mmetsp:Transcript_45643/g.106472  ORF Transcript_45643/g.106472 Transcript_45643/m.106472 type:complete len:275 (-) Transcript_45643:860-1684(-)
MSAVATMHETAAANIGARSEPPETESSGPSTIETSSSGKHMNKFIVAMNAPALFVSAAARPTNAYGMTMNAEKGMPRTATLATARVGELIQPMLSKTAQWTSSQTKKTRPSPSRSTSRGVIGESASVTNDAKSMPRELARAPSLYRNLAGWSSSREGSGSPPHTCTPMYAGRYIHVRNQVKKSAKSTPNMRCTGTGIEGTARKAAATAEQGPNRFPDRMRISLRGSRTAAWLMAIVRRSAVLAKAKRNRTSAKSSPAYSSSRKGKSCAVSSEPM